MLRKGDSALGGFVPSTWFDIKMPTGRKNIAIEISGWEKLVANTVRLLVPRNR